MKRYIKCQITKAEKDEFNAILSELYQFDRTHYDLFQKELSNDQLLSISVADNHIVIYLDDTEAHFTDTDEAMQYVENILDSTDTNVLSSITICNPSETKNFVYAAISTRSLSDKLVRVKSSNLWSYGINIRDRHQTTGDVIVQFKGKDGGPNGGLYIYYDIPIKLWQRWLTAPSKGSFFWRHIRNVFKYSRLDGNKRGYLPNAIN